MNCVPAVTRDLADAAVLANRWTIVAHAAAPNRAGSTVPRRLPDRPQPASSWKRRVQRSDLTQRSGRTARRSRRGRSARFKRLHVRCVFALASGSTRRGRLPQQWVSNGEGDARRRRQARAVPARACDTAERAETAPLAVTSDRTVTGSRLCRMRSLAQARCSSSKRPRSVITARLQVLLQRRASRQSATHLGLPCTDGRAAEDPRKHAPGFEGSSREGGAHGRSQPNQTAPSPGWQTERPGRGAAHHPNPCGN